MNFMCVSFKFRRNAHEILLNITSELILIYGTIFYFSQTYRK